MLKIFSSFVLKASLQDAKNVIDIENGNFYLPVMAPTLKLNGGGGRLRFCWV